MSNPDLANYKIYRSTTPGGPYGSSIASSTVNSYTDTTASNGTTYYYVVSAIDTEGNESTYSNEVIVIAVTPTAPQNLTATSGQDSQGNPKITLNWNAPTSNNGASITNYRIYKGNSLGGESFFKEVGNVLTYTDKDVGYNTYYYKVSAKNSRGEGPQSNEAQATISKSDPCRDPLNPCYPGDPKEPTPIRPDKVRKLNPYY